MPEVLYFLNVLAQCAIHFASCNFKFQFEDYALLNPGPADYNA